MKDLITTTEIHGLLNRAQEILDLFQRAHQLGYSLTLRPEQLKEVIEILEFGYLGKP